MEVNSIADVITGVAVVSLPTDTISGQLRY
jgi:hypothetical protein